MDRIETVYHDFITVDGKTNPIHVQALMNYGLRHFEGNINTDNIIDHTQKDNNQNDNNQNDNIHNENNQNDNDHNDNDQNDNGKDAQVYARPTNSAMLMEWTELAPADAWPVYAFLLEHGGCLEMRPDVAVAYAHNALLLGKQSHLLALYKWGFTLLDQPLLDPRHLEPWFIDQIGGTRTLEFLIRRMGLTTGSLRGYFRWAVLENRPDWLRWLLVHRIDCGGGGGVGGDQNDQDDQNNQDDQDHNDSILADQGLLFVKAIDHRNPWILLVLLERAGVAVPPWTAHFVKGKKNYWSRGYLRVNQQESRVFRELLKLTCALMAKHGFQLARQRANQEYFREAYYRAMQNFGLYDDAELESKRMS